MFSSRHRAKLISALLSGVFLSVSTLAVYAKTPNLEAPQQLETPQQEGLQLQVKISAFEKSIEQLEDSYDYYSPQLGEQLGSLARLYQQQGQHPKALKTLNRAHRINRINNGIYHDDNSLLVEQKITNLMAMERWAEVGSHYRELFWLQRRQYGENDPRLRPLIERIGQWHIKAYTFELGGNLLNHLLAAHKLFSLSLSISQHQPESLSQGATLENLALASYYLAVHREETATPVQAKYNFFSPQPHPTPARDDHIILSSYSNGLGALKRNVELYKDNPDAPADAYPKALIKLADWYQLFDKRASARRLYREVWDTLEQQQNISTLEKLFDRPVNLPENAPLDNPKQDQTSRDIVMKFNVTAYGTAKSIRFDDEKSVDNVALKVKARNRLRSLRFRPKMAEGKPVATKNLVMRYRFEGKTL